MPLLLPPAMLLPADVYARHYATPCHAMLLLMLFRRAMLFSLICCHAAIDAAIFATLPCVFAAATRAAQRCHAAMLCLRLMRDYGALIARMPPCQEAAAYARCMLRATCGMF